MLMVCGPVVSDIPKSSRMVMSRLRKYFRVSAEIGAAPLKKR
jgi:hypothetical protein